MATLSHLAILDDYQGVARALGPWERLPASLEVEVFRDHLTELDALAERLREVDAIVAMRERTPFTRELLERLPKLRLLITSGMRNSAIDLVACAERKVTVCGTPAVGAPTADLTWALILALVRDLPGQQRALREGRWQTRIGVGLEGKTLGVIGLGKLGTRVAKIGNAFGMRVIGWSQNLTEEAAIAAGARRVSKEQLLRESDVVTLHLVLSERSRNTLGTGELALMKPTAFLVNTSRAGLVDQHALLDALSARRIAGAGLDVFDEEPLPPDHPLLLAPNTVLTPHLGYVTEENYRAYFTGAVEDIEAFLRDAPIRLLTSI